MLSATRIIIIFFVIACSTVLIFSLLFLQDEESRQFQQPSFSQQQQRVIDQQQRIIEYQQLLLKQTNARPALDLEDFPDLAGPRIGPVPTNKSLVAICVGKSDKASMNNLVKFFPESEFTLMLFHYDNSTWGEFEWYHKLNVVAIRVLHKMKFWYIKRFITPDLASGFAHVIILDVDVIFSEDTFNPSLYLSIIDSYNIALSQPAHDHDSATAHIVVREQKGDMIGRYTDFVESGPAVFMTLSGYLCVYDLLQLDMFTGWGLDAKWGNWVREHCGLGNYSVAVIDMLTLHRNVAPGNETSNPVFNDLAPKEYYTFLDRFSTIGNTGKKEFGRFGSRACVGKNKTFPKECMDVQPKS